MNIALIAHDNKKELLINLVKEFVGVLTQHTLYSTRETGRLIEEKAGLSVHKSQSGPYGGDQQIGAKVASNKVDMVIFLRDPLKAMPHESDVSALLRICDVHIVPLATNIGTARLLLDTL